MRSHRSGVTTAKELPYFRKAYPEVLVKTGPRRVASARLPSDRNPRHTYGLPGTHRTVETIKHKGPEEPAMKHLIQGAYQEDWLKTNYGSLGPAERRQAAYVPPVPTRAAIGHAIGAQQKYLQRQEGNEEWKMRKFLSVPARVTQFTARPGSSRPREQQQHWTQDAEQRQYEEEQGQQQQQEEQ